VTSVSSVVKNDAPRPVEDSGSGGQVLFHRRGHGGHGGVRQPRLAHGPSADPIQPFLLVRDNSGVIRAAAAAVAWNGSKRHSPRSCTRPTLFPQPFSVV